MSKPSWISVADCPPADGDVGEQYYWVYAPTNPQLDNGVSGPVWFYDGKWQFECRIESVDSGYVTHYMPYFVPEPPDGEVME